MLKKVVAVVIFLLMFSSISMVKAEDVFEVPEDAIEHGRHKIYRSHVSSSHYLSDTYMKVAKIAYKDTYAWTTASVKFETIHAKSNINFTVEGLLRIRKNGNHHLYYETKGHTSQYDEEPIKVVTARDDQGSRYYEIWAYVPYKHDNVGTTLDVYAEGLADLDIEMFDTRVEGIFDAANGHSLINPTGTKSFNESTKIGLGTPDPKGDFHISKYGEDVVVGASSSRPVILLEDNDSGTDSANADGPTLRFSNTKVANKPWSEFTFLPESSEMVIKNAGLTIDRALDVKQGITAAYNVEAWDLKAKGGVNSEHHVVADGHISAGTTITATGNITSHGNIIQAKENSSDTVSLGNANDIPHITFVNHARLDANPESTIAGRITFVDTLHPDSIVRTHNASGYIDYIGSSDNIKITHAGLEIDAGAAERVLIGHDNSQPSIELIDHDTSNGPSGLIKFTSAVNNTSGEIQYDSGKGQIHVKNASLKADKLLADEFLQLQLRTEPPENPEPGMIYADASQAICTFLGGEWYKMAGPKEGKCGADHVVKPTSHYILRLQ